MSRRHSLQNPSARICNPPPPAIPKHASSGMKVARHQPALKVLEALQDVLDEDAPEFVTKLYQVRRSDSHA